MIFGDYLSVIKKCDIIYKVTEDEQGSGVVSKIIFKKQYL